MVDIDDDPVDLEANKVNKSISEDLEISDSDNEEVVVTSPIIKFVDFLKAIFGSKPNKKPIVVTEKNTLEKKNKPIINELPKDGEANNSGLTSELEKTQPKNLDEITTPLTGSLATVIIRNDFYRDGFRNMIKIAIAESIIIIVLILSFIAYLNATEAKNHYFATTADGRIMRLVPLNLPNMNTSALMSWVSQAATEVMTFGYHDYQRRMQQSSRHFTRKGWETFTAALQKSRIIDSVEASKQVVTARPRSAPVLRQEGSINGVYRWVVDLPLTVLYRSATSSRSDNLNIRLVIYRVPSLENPNGVGIEQWIAVAAR